MNVPDFRIRPELTEDGQVLAELVVRGFDDLTKLVAGSLPGGRPMSLVMTKLEEANQWAQALIGQVYAVRRDPEAP